MLLNGSATANPPSPEPVPGQQQSNSNSRENLGLLLSCLLAEIHGGQISVQGSPDAGYRYVVSLPPMESEETFDD
jgi:signal transduction histidine kinase